MRIKIEDLKLALQYLEGASADGTVNVALYHNTTVVFDTEFDGASVEVSVFEEDTDKRPAVEMRTVFSLVK